MLNGIAGYSTADPARLGCLVANVAVVVPEAGVQELVQRMFAANDEFVRNRLATAVDEGQLPPGYPVARATSGIVNAMLAIPTRARIGASRRELRRLVDDATRAAMDMPPG